MKILTQNSEGINTPQENIQAYRLSPQQEHLWLLQQGNIYRAECAVLIEGNLKTDILKKALERTVERHEILRTTFRWLSEMTVPVQVIADDHAVSMDGHDLSCFEPQQQTARIEAFIHERNQRPFNLEQGPLLGASLCTLSPGKHVLLITLPALCADPAALNILVHEISCAYRACLHNEELTGEPMQYADFAEWQNEILEAEDADTGRQYWRKQDIAALLTLKLPFERQPSEDLEFEPEYLAVTLNSDTVVKVKSLAESYGTSASVFLLACWHVLLWRITGQSDFGVGVAYDGRKYEELEQALGLFAKYLPLPIHLDENVSFSNILKHVDEAAREADKWQEYFAWGHVRGPAGNVEGSTFFPICFDFKEQPAKYSAADLSFSIYEQYACIDRFKVKLSCINRGDSLTAEFHYDSNLVSVEDVGRLAGQYHTLLESAITNPHAAIFELKILSEAERQQLLVEFNDTETDYSKGRCVHQLFEAQVERTPDAIAVAYEGRQLTYKELNGRANQLAHHLQRLGVGPDALVAIYVERSLEMIVGLLGILKAGGAYVPLDPALPKERLAFMLEDTQARVLLTERRLLERLPEHGAELVSLDEDWETIARESQENVISGVTTENLVYVMFTSGSTGKPKGVAVEHRQLLNYINAILERLDLPAGSTFAMVSTFAADLGNTVLFPSLCSGSCLHVVSLERARDPDALAGYFRRHEIDCLKIVPSHLAALLSSSHPEQILPRKRLVLGGEASTCSLIERLQVLAPDCLILNHYGPTEATVGVITCEVDKSQACHLSTGLPLGRPLANTRIYLLDSRLEPVPIWVSGELYVGGESLARGYLNRPDLTAERFIPDPFSNTQGARLYKTGDLARYLPGGGIHYLGRTDHQVKIHGYRIELGEIEAVLRAHPSVGDSVVVAREDELGEKRLIAYVAGVQKGMARVSELRSHLKERLPEYMVPGAYVIIEELPLTPNGKVDRRALPAPEQTRPEIENGFVAARTPVEEALAGIWCQVLGLKQVGVYDNFFELGGDSILSIQIIARANQAGLRLTPKQLFQHQTVADLAAVAGMSQAIDIEQGAVTGPVLLTPVQRRFFEQNLPDPHHYNQSIMLEVPGALDPALLERVVQQLLVHHDALRLRFVREQSGWQQANAGALENPVFSRVDLSLLPETEQESTMKKVASELQASLKLSEGPLVRVALFNVGRQKSGRLLLIIHHLAVDGVSWRILLEDLQTAYQQLSRGEAINLPPKTTSFKHWAERLAQHARSETLRQEITYWLAERWAQISRLPVDHDGGANTKASARTVSASLGVEETRALLQDVSAAYHTQINDVLLTALAQAFARWTGSRRLLIDLEGHGREEIVEAVDLSRTVGWFTAVFPVLLELSEIGGPGDGLMAIKEQLREIPNRGIGYGLLRYVSGDAQIAEKLRALPKAEVIFNYLGQFDQMLPESSPFRRAKESHGPDQSLSGERRYLLTIIGGIKEGRLQVDWTYSDNVHRRATVEYLAQEFVETLRSLIAHCQLSPVGGFTPSDFPKAKLSQKDLNKVLARISESTSGDPNQDA